MVNRDGLLRSIAETGYNVGFGAKKHFATYDIVEKLPGLIGFISLAVGIFSLVFEQLSAKVPSACLATAGVAALYISPYDHGKADYDRVGKELTQIFNELRDLFRGVRGGADLDISQAQLRALEDTYYKMAISKQILFSDWYAHYKFFAQHQYEWIEEQRPFTWRDRIPLSFAVACLSVLVAVIVVALSKLR